MQMFRFLNFNLTLLQGTKRLDCISEHLYQVLQYEPMISEFWWELNQLIALKIPTNLAGNLNITNEFLSKKSRSMTIVAKLIFFRFWLPSDAGQIGTKGPVLTLSYSVDLFFFPKTVNFFFYNSPVFHQLCLSPIHQTRINIFKIQKIKACFNRRDITSTRAFKHEVIPIHSG